MTLKITNPKDWTLASLPMPATVAIEDAVARLDAVDNTLGTLGSESPIPALKKASASLRAAIPFAATTLKSAAKAYQSTLSAASSMGKAAAAKVPTTGFTSPEMRDLAVAGARLDPFQSAWKTAVQDAIAERSAKADALVKAAIDAMTASKAELDRALAKWSGPVMLRGAMDASRYARIDAFTKEERRYRPTAILEHLESVIAAGDEEVEDDFILAIETVLGDLAKLSLVQLGRELELPVEMVNRNDGAVSKEQAAIFAVRRRIEARRVERTPEPLKYGGAIYSQLLGAYSLLMGWNATLITRTEFEQFYLSPTPGNALSPHANWLVRMLPGCPPTDGLLREAPMASPWSR